MSYGYNVFLSKIAQGGAKMNAILKFVFRVLVLLGILAIVIFVWPGPQLRNVKFAPAPAQQPVITVVAPAQACPVTSAPAPAQQPVTIVAPTQACPVTTVPVSAVPATPVPAAEFGPEMHFPGSVSGPAIAELWNPNTGFCAVVRVNQSEILQWPFNGSWFQAPSVNALNARWPSYLAEYYTKPSNIANGCKTFISAADVPQH
jgi:hypothetical protein